MYERLYLEAWSSREHRWFKRHFN